MSYTQVISYLIFLKGLGEKPIYAYTQCMVQAYMQPTCSTDEIISFRGGRGVEPATPKHALDLSCKHLKSVYYTDNSSLFYQPKEVLSIPTTGIPSKVHWSTSLRTLYNSDQPRWGGKRAQLGPRCSQRQLQHAHGHKRGSRRNNLYYRLKELNAGIKPERRFL